MACKDGFGLKDDGTCSKCTVANCNSCDKNVDRCARLLLLLGGSGAPAGARS